MSNTYPWPASGNIGIGTASPNLDSGGVSTYLSVLGGGSTYADDGRLELANPKSSPASGDEAGQIRYICTANNGDMRVGFIIVNLAGSGGANGFGSQMSFTTKKDNSIGQNEALVIDNNGNVGIGTTTPAALLDVNGSVNVAALSAGGIVTSTSGVLGVTAAAGVDTTALHTGSVAGGDLTGTYPNPTLIATGPGATGPIGSSTTVPVVTIDAKGRITALTSAAIASNPPGFIYPETYGAVGNGTSDDTAALNSAISVAATQGKILILTQQYAISSTLSMSCCVWSTPTSTIVPYGTYVGNAITMATAVTNNLIATFGIISGFTGGTGIIVSSASTPVWKLNVTQITNCSTAIYVNGGGCNASVGMIAGCTNCFYVTGPAQGVDLYCDFGTGNTYGLYFDGSANANGNSCVFSSWDSDGITGSIFFNSGGGGYALAQWTLSVLDWCGNGTGSGALNAGFFASGAFNSCKFFISAGGEGSAFWNCFTCTGNNNTVQSLNSTGYSGMNPSTWQTASAHRSSFSSASWYANSQYCTGTISSSLAAGASITIYVYSPYTSSQLGSSFGFRVSGPISTANLSAANGSGLVCTQIFDNSATVANELILTITNTSSTATSTSIPYNFYLIAGIP